MKMIMKTRQEAKKSSLVEEQRNYLERKYTFSKLRRSTLGRKWCKWITSVFQISGKEKTQSYTNDCDVYYDEEQYRNFCYRKIMRIININNYSNMENWDVSSLIGRSSFIEEHPVKDNAHLIYGSPRPIELHEEFSEEESIFICRYRYSRRNAVNITDSNEIDQLLCLLGYL